MGQDEYNGRRYSQSPDEFDPRNITQSNMNKLADGLRQFVELMEDCAVPADSTTSREWEDYKRGMKRVKRLIDKLEQGDRSVFKDEEEWNPLR